MLGVNPLVWFFDLVDGVWTKVATGQLEIKSRGFNRKNYPMGRRHFRIAESAASQLEECDCRYPSSEIVYDLNDLFG